MTIRWCSVCHTRHVSRRDCPGELLARGVERHGWRVVVRAETRAEVYGVLVAECRDRWRARILTYPNMLWSVPGGRGTMKFVGDSPQEAESQAIEFILAHCRARGYEIADESPSVESAPVAAEANLEAARAAVEKQPRGSRDHRYLRSMVIRFGNEKTDRVGMTADLSRSGMFVISDRPLPAGSSVKMLLELEQYSVPLVGKVAWHRENAEQGRPAGMGIQLKNPPHLYARYVATLDGGDEPDPAEDVAIRSRRKRG